MSVAICDQSIGTAPATPPPETMLGAWASSSALVYCRDLSGCVLAANRAFARKFGRTPGELPGTPVAALLHPDDVAGFRPDSAPPDPFHRTTREQRWLTPQGWRWVSWEETTLVDENGRAAGVRAVGHDITRQRLAEEQYTRLSCAVEQSPVAIAITDADGRAQYVNGKFTQTTGHTLEHILDHNVPVLREGHPDEKSYEQFWSAVRAGREWHGELARQGPNGTKIWESVRVFCARNGSGEVTNLVCLREDITERRNLSAQLRQAQKMEDLGTLAGGIAHDFNNLLAVINGYAEFSLSNSADPAVLMKSLREIQRAAQRAGGLVRQILTFSRKTEVRFTPVDLNQLVRDLVALLAETFPRTVSFQLALQEKLPPLLADQNQLQQIVLNFCVNARDAMPGGGAISLATSVRPGNTLTQHPEAPAQINFACLEVTDTGMGMPPEVRARIFEPFFTTKQAGQGTGLGLAVVYGIVTSHHGFIEVDSTSGVGSTFRVFLPMVDNVVTLSTATVATDFPGGTEKLLVVDDEMSLRRLLEAALSRKGYHVDCAADGLEAIEIIGDTNRAIDAVLLDLNMPGASGIDVYKVIRACRPGLKVLVLSGHLTAKARLEFEHLGQKHFVNKPYTLDELGRRIRTLLDGVTSDHP
jgi:PAS domain S-box-containing protein